MRSYISFPFKLQQKIHRKNVNDSSIEIRSKKKHWYDFDISLIEVTSKKFVEMTWIFIDIFFSTYQRNIDIKPASIRRGLSGA